MRSALLFMFVSLSACGSPAPRASSSAVADIPSVDAGAAGTWTPASVDRWRAAMDGYRSGVRTGNQTIIGARAVPLAVYLNSVHRLLHPWFADTFLPWAKGRPAFAGTLVSRIEVAIAADGRIARSGVIDSSGVPEFDASALEAFERAGPMPPTPNEIRSADGLVWVHWDLHGDETDACSTRGARPFILAP